MSFDRDAYTQRLIAKGVAPERAAAIAEKMDWSGSDQPQRGLALVPSPSADAVQQGELLAPAAAATSVASSVAAVKRGRGRPPKSHAPSAREEDLFQLSLDIEKTNARNSGDIGFLTTAMVFASLPHRKVWQNPTAPADQRVEAEVYRRKAGSLQLAIWSPHGLPYGKIPRLITVYLCTQAARTQHPLIDLGKSQAEFCSRLGIGTTGGERGDATRFKEQAQRLFSSAINLSSTDPSSWDFQLHNVQLVKSAQFKNLQLWSPHEDGGERRTWRNQLQLTADFFQQCVDHPVPIDLRVLREMRSPLGIDIYIWLTYRYNSISTATPISWQQLKWQFGSQYSDDEQGLRNFIHEFRQQLKAVRAVYPGARFSTDAHKLTLIPSKPHISIAVSNPPPSA